MSCTGKEQAYLTGLRLVALNYPYTKLISSTMTRAKETADIIHKQLPELPREESDLLREGAPIPPEPPVGHWRPEASVRYCLPVAATDLCLLLVHKPVLTLMRNVPDVHQ